MSWIGKIGRRTVARDWRVVVAASAPQLLVHCDSSLACCRQQILGAAMFAHYRLSVKHRARSMMIDGHGDASAA